MRSGRQEIVAQKSPHPWRIIMKICIYGAGAIGGYLGVQFARTGADVSLVARGAHLAAMREHGLKLLIGDRGVATLYRQSR
jgi:ketopantoate reductase